MKMTITGIELNAGVSQKSGKAYSIGQLHTSIPLAPARGEGNIAKGAVGRSYECPAAVLEKIAKLPFPVTAEVDLREEMAFGKPRMTVVDVTPGTIARAA